MAAPKPARPRRRITTPPVDAAKTKRDKNRNITIDWDRVRRDYATNKFTDAELAQMHGCARGSITRRRTEDRAINPAAWPIDRTEDVRRASAALLMQEAVAAGVAAGDSAESVLVAATLVKDVILGHRTEIREARSVAGRLLSELDATTLNKSRLAAMLETTLEGLGDEDKAAMRRQFSEFMKLHSRVASIQKLADSLQRLQTQERKAFGIRDDEGTSNPLDTMSERELEAELQRLGQQLQGLDARVTAAEAKPADPVVPAGDDGPEVRVH